MSFTVRVRENSHYMDESEAYTSGPYAIYAEAEAACRKMVDEFLTASLKPGQNAEALFELYTMFGEDPTVEGAAAEDKAFSAWDYAWRRCRELCAG